MCNHETQIIRYPTDKNDDFEHYCRRCFSYSDVASEVKKSVLNIITTHPL